MANVDGHAPIDPQLSQQAAPELTPAQLSRLQGYGRPMDVEVGDTVLRSGDAAYDLVVVERGAVDIVRAATRDAPEEVITRHGAGRFVGELNLLTGQTTYLTGRVVEAGRVWRISPERFRRLMAEDPELSDLLLRAFLARRNLLRGSEAARSLEIIGNGMSATSLALRTYAARQQLPHMWFDSDSTAGQALMTTAELTTQDLPAVLTPETMLRRVTPGELAEHLGLSYHRSADQPVDLTVIGGGPAGLAAAVYGSSEGLATVLLDAVGTGGQAAASSRIENYLGFPSGISGGELAGKASLQALKFGAELSSPCEVVGLDTAGDQLRVALSDGTDIVSRAVIIASGASYRSLPIDRWSDFVGAGIYYAATELEARACGEDPVTVVGGANSAGQAALYLAARGSQVTVAVRGADLTAGMSTYLVDRLIAHPGITVRVATEVIGLDGESTLEQVTLRTRADGPHEAQLCRGLFCFIGAAPATSWLTGVAVDEDGFVRTDSQLLPQDLGPAWTALGRAPLPFETSVPGVFAAGDVRSGSMKRVAAAVGEGASSVRSVHQAIGARHV
ncbi:MAG TPA: FAD-dependent oxidoreductase [Pseudonocardiaceae bacterium]|jgi:thioredoxin reductase (NADPH)|nr:FAD-dependent oxidoreductase [Pseudonocardiaceae bacterium]